MTVALQPENSFAAILIHGTFAYSSMVDPTYSGQVEALTDKQKKAAKAKGKKNRLGAG